MRITNQFELPEPYWRATAMQRPQQEKRISVTELLKPPQMRALERLHRGELEQDCSERLDTFFGTAVHEHLANHAPEGAWAEETLEWTDPESGWTVHGTPDLIEGRRLTDWKTTRVRALKYDRQEWLEQVNLYAHLVRLCGREITEAVVWAFCRDWDPQIRGTEGYPQAGIVQIPMPLWDASMAHGFLLARLGLHQAAEQGEYRPCTDEERWMRHTWSVYRKDRDGRAVRAGFETEVEAWQYADALTDPIQKTEDWYEVSRRDGEPVRCLAWCDVRSVCPQQQAESALVRQLEESLRLRVVK